MTAAVKIFSHRGLVAPRVTTTSQTSSDAVFVLEQPYLAREALTAGASATASSAATCPAETTLLRIEVQDSKTIGLELNPPGRSVAATANSPTLSGKDTYQAGKDWTISVIDLTA